jgi:ABC-2 type transport system permease protein
VTFFLLILLVVYSRTKEVAGWNRGEAFVLAATCFLMNAMAMALTMSLMEIPQQVRQGTLDFVLTKPVNSQFWVSTRKFNFDQMGTFIAGIAMVFVGVAQSGASPNLGQFAGYVVLLFASLVIFYSFNLCLMTLGVWWVRVDNLWVLGETMLQVARFPIDIFGGQIGRVLTYVVPLAFLATVPARQLVHGLDVRMVVLGVVWAGFALIFSAFFWRFALRSYASASS